MIKELIKELRSLKNPEKISIYKNFHKTKKGSYAHGEEFFGITVPQLNILAKKYHSEISLNEISKLLNSKIHEEKYIAVILLTNKYKTTENKKEIVDFYLKNAKRISGWDLVDSTASKILGNYLIDKDKSILYKLAKSDNIWEKRISIISTHCFVRNNQFDETLKIAYILLNDKHDLIHKAVGWMLREVGNRDNKVLENFLKKHYKKMPRTMLRYSIEKFSKNKRMKYIKK